MILFIMLVTYSTKENTKSTRTLSDTIYNNRTLYDINYSISIYIRLIGHSSVERRERLFFFFRFYDYRIIVRHTSVLEGKRGGRGSVLTDFGNAHE